MTCHGAAGGLAGPETPLLHAFHSGGRGDVGPLRTGGAEAFGALHPAWSPPGNSRCARTRGGQRGGNRSLSRRAPEARREEDLAGGVLCAASVTSLTAAYFTQGVPCIQILPRAQHCWDSSRC